MQSINRIQNRPLPAFRQTPPQDAPKHFERLEQRVFFSAGNAALDTVAGSSSNAALVYDLNTSATSAYQSPIAPVVPPLRDLGPAARSLKAANFTTAPAFLPAVLDGPGSDDILVGRHMKSPWSSAVSQPSESLQLNKRDAIAAAARDIGPLPPSGKGLVLLVEDDAASRNALSTILRRRGWRVETAATLSDGMRLLDTHPDRVIVDLMLPDGDGGKIVQRLNDTGMSSRVTVMTGVSDPARLARIKAMGPGAVLQKPVSVSALLHDLASSVHAAAA